MKCQTENYSEKTQMPKSILDFQEGQLLLGFHTNEMKLLEQPPNF